MTKSDWAIYCQQLPYYVVLCSIVTFTMFILTLHITVMIHL